MLARLRGMLNREDNNFIGRVINLVIDQVGIAPRHQFAHALHILPPPRSRKQNQILERLQDIGIAALTIHGRTRKQMYKGPADWTLTALPGNGVRIVLDLQ